MTAAAVARNPETVNLLRMCYYATSSCDRVAVLSTVAMEPLPLCPLVGNLEGIVFAAVNALHGCFVSQALLAFRNVI